MANTGLIKNLTAEGTIAPRRIVKPGANDYGVVQGAAATDSLIGVTGELGAASGDDVDVILTGIVDLEFGGAVTRGGEVTSDASGKGVAAAPGAGTNNRIIGIALVTAASGDIAPVLLAQGLKQG